MRVSRGLGGRIRYGAEPLRATRFGLPVLLAILSFAPECEYGCCAPTTTQCSRMR